MKTEKIRTFGRLQAVNGRYRNTSGTCECTEILLDGSRTLWLWKYHWINRPRQRYDYESSLRDALRDMLTRISRKQYEELQDDIMKIRKTLGDMENYNRSNWN